MLFERHILADFRNDKSATVNFAGNDVMLTKKKGIAALFNVHNRDLTLSHNGFLLQIVTLMESCINGTYTKSSDKEI